VRRSFCLCGHLPRNISVRSMLPVGPMQRRVAGNTYRVPALFWLSDIFLFAVGYWPVLAPSGRF
jgi:hypothetical protein